MPSAAVSVSVAASFAAFSVLQIPFGAARFRLAAAPALALIAATWFELSATHAMNAMRGPAYGKATAFSAIGSLLVLLAGAVLGVLES